MDFLVRLTGIETAGKLSIVVFIGFFTVLAHKKRMDVPTVFPCGVFARFPRVWEFLWERKPATET
jgi:hypothetical protein